jgi:hypothetical protein
LASADSTAASIAVKLRVVLWQMNIDNADCANPNGVRTNKPTDD